MASKHCCTALPKTKVKARRVALKVEKPGEH
jgi:hypothetical protein